MRRNVLRTKNHASIGRKIFTKIVVTLVFVLLTNTMFSQAGAALDFDGANDYVQVGNIMPATYTKEAWFYVSNLGLQNNLISGGADGQHALYPSATYGNKLSAGHNGTWNSVQDPTPIVANTWYHVALTYDAATTTMKLYKNGVLVSTNTSVPPFIGGNALRLGSFDAVQNLLGGKLDEVRIWNRVLPQCEIQNNMNGELPSGQVGLVAYYKFNQGIASGNNVAITTLTDSSGNANTGTLNGFALTGAASNWVTPGGVVTGTMSPAPLSVTSPQVFCTGSTVANLTATGTSIKWYNVATGGTALVSTTVLATGTYYVTQTTGTCESPRTAVTVTINTTAIPTATSPQTFNTGATVANLVATGTALQWYAASTGGAALVSTTPLATGLYYVSQIIAGCESLRRSVQVNINGASLNFNATTDYVDIGTAIATAIDPINTITVEAWVYPTAVSNGLGNNFGMIVGNYNTSANNMQFMLRKESGTDYAFWVNCGAGYQAVGAVNSLTLNTWQHIAGVWNGSDIKIYINGVLKNTTTGVTGSSFVTLANPIRMGKNLANEKFVGNIDEVRIWRRALPQCEIQNNMNTELQSGQIGLLAYYKFNQGIASGNNASINTLTDSSGNAYTGTLNSFSLTGTASNWTAPGAVVTGTMSPTLLSVVSPQAFNTGATVANLVATGTTLQWYAVSTGGAALVSTTPLATGLYYISQTIAGCESPRTAVQVNINGAALDFDGVNDQVSFGNAMTTALGGTNKLTAEAWVKTTNTTGTKTFISNHGNGSATQFDLRSVGGNFDCILGFGTYVVTAGTVVPNTWQHVAMVFDGVTLKLYVNGVNVGTTNTPSYTLPASTAPIIIGNNGYGEIFQGKMDEVRVWNRALPQAEIQNNMNCELGSGQTGLVAYYKFNQGIDNASNTTINTLTDSSGNTNTGTLNGFTLTGTTSNWTGTGGVTTGNTCSTYLAMNDFDFSSKLSVYPNPSSDVFSINSDTNGKIVVYDLIGKIIKSENIDLGITKLDLSNYPSGIYLIKVTNDSNQTKTMKLIKQ
jgi:hypothetical protein